MNPLIVGNWKMNKTLAEAVSFVQSVGEGLDQLRNVDVVICPPFLSLPVLDGLLHDSRVSLGAQNVSAWENGTHTGEVSAAMLSAHCSYVIVGHSERRQANAETSEIVNEKSIRAIEAGLTPIVCVSNEEELAVLSKIKGKQKQWTVAFEPIEAIGSGKPANPDDVAAMVKKIKKSVGSNSRVIYGGSVDLDNIKVYLKVSDGALPGGASLDPRNFLDLCKIANGQ